MTHDRTKMPPDELMGKVVDEPEFMRWVSTVVCMLDQVLLDMLRKEQLWENMRRYG